MVVRPNYTLLKLRGLGPGGVPTPQIVPIGVTIPGATEWPSFDAWQKEKLPELSGQVQDYSITGDTETGYQEPATADRFIGLSDVGNMISGLGNKIAPYIPSFAPGGTGPTPPMASVASVPGWMKDFGYGITHPLEVLQEDPVHHSPFRDAIIGAGRIGWQGLYDVGTAMNPITSAKNAFESWKDIFWDPGSEYGKKPEQFGPPMPDKPAEEIYGPEAGGGPGGTGATGGATSAGTFEGGTKFIPPKPPEITPVVYPDPPAPTMPAPLPLQKQIDFAPYLKKLEEYEPKDLDRRSYMRERLLSNLSRAFAAGAGGSGWSGGTGALARFGGGFGTSQANTTDQYLTEQANVDEAQRQFGVERTNLEMKLASEANRIANENALTQWKSGEATRQAQGQYEADKYNVLTKNIAAAKEAEQQNLDRLYNWEVTKGQLTETRVLPGTGKGIIVLEHTDPDGKINYEYKNFNDYGTGNMTNDQLNALQDIGAIYGTNSDRYKSMIYGSIQTPYDFAKNVAGEAVTAGQLEALEPLMPDVDFAEIDKEVKKDLMAQGVDPSNDKYPEMYKDGMASLLGPQLDLQNPQVLEILASQGNYGARILLEKRAQRANQK